MEYPKEIVSFIKKTKTFAIDAKFTKCETEKPLIVFDDTFSRFVMTIIQDSDAITCNIPIEQIAYMEAASNIALEKQLSMNAVPEGASPAFTERFVTGSLKGKSPAEVLSENGENGKDMLNKEYNWLKSNLEKYPANQKLMDAIKDAAKLNSEDLAANETSCPPIKILDIGCRPKVRNKRDDGKCLCYEGKVTWNPAQKYPVCAEIKNYYAPVDKKEDGTLNVRLKEKDIKSEKSYTFNMTAQEWMHAISQMKLTKDSFVMVNFAKAWQIADAAETEARLQNTKKEDSPGTP